MFRIVLVIIAAVLANLQAQQSAPGSIVLTHATLIDGTGAPPQIGHDPSH
jgi:hypothetical protein